MTKPSSFQSLSSLTLIAAIIIHLTIGLTHIWGVMKVYLYSQARLQNPSLSLKDTFYGSPLLSIFGNFKFLSPFLIRFTSHRLIMSVGILSLVLGVFSASQMTDMDYMILAVTIPGGVCISICQMVPIQCCNELLPEQKGRIVGVILCCFSLSSLVINSLITLLCNPEGVNPVSEGDSGNIQQPEEVARNFPDMLRWMAVIFAVVGFLGILLCQRKEKLSVNEGCKLTQDKVRTLVVDTTQNHQTNQTSDDNSSVLKGLNEPIFICCFIFTVISSMTGGFVSNMFSTIGQGIFHQDQSTISMIAFQGPLCNAGARIIVGQMVENKHQPMEFKSVVNSYYIMLFIGLMLMTFVYNKQMQIIGVNLVQLFLGSSIAIPAIFIPRQLGAKTGSEVQGILTISIIIAHLMTFIPKQLQDQQGFEQTFVFIISANLISFTLINIFQKGNLLDKKKSWFY